MRSTRAARGQGVPRSGVNECLPQLAYPGNLADELFAGFQETLRVAAEANPGGRAGEDDVAGQQGGDPGKPLDQGGHRENGVTRAAVLDGFSVDRAHQLDVVGICEFVDRDHPGPDRGEPREGLTEAELRGRPGQLNDPLRDVLPRQ